MITKAINQTPGVSAIHQFGIFDKKGREIGSRITTFECDYVEFVPAQRGYVCDRAPGHYYVLVVQATRDGRDYGASQRTQYFVIAAARDLKIRRYLDEAKRRAAVTAGVAAIDTI